MNPWLAASAPFGHAQRRALIDDSWTRARRRQLDPERTVARASLASDDVRAYRDAHPLARAMPMIRKLLVDDTVGDSGLLVAVGDAAGQLLWVEGDPTLRRRAEAMGFAEGAGWAEPEVGTSAPGTALALDHGIQVSKTEHYAAAVRDWSCTAVPVHDLDTHEIIGVLDITGGDEVVAPHTLPFLAATAAAVERELLVQRLRLGRLRRAPRVARAPRLEVLGRDTGALTAAARRVELSLRHAEILTLLAWHRAGLAAEDLADAVYGRPDAQVTVRAELVRLRHLLEREAPSVRLLGRPYRLGTPIDLDAGIVLGLLDRGSHRAAAKAYSGTLLPASTAPGIESIREEIVARLRESMLESASPESLLAFAQSPAGVNDAEVWRTALTILPARSPKRAGVVAHLERMGDARR